MGNRVVPHRSSISFFGSARTPHQTDLLPEEGPLRRNQLEAENQVRDRFWLTDHPGLRSCTLSFHGYMPYKVVRGHSFFHSWFHFCTDHKEVNHPHLAADMLSVEEGCCTCCTEFSHRMSLSLLRTGSISDREALVQIQAFYAFPPFLPVFSSAVLLTF